MGRRARRGGGGDARASGERWGVEIIAR
jgi:hypothetical protein